ncbi:chondroitin proteoglycan 2-like isoform X2 [Argiope bruennichi]|uniref:chondroitin proteoglycan 2-like isoform X2 n=1 Tax=Argiope bruennichi TaxID=94029 RepID=UPI0024951F59|nr:chondroitin proteoglycan 2-like isoform X2 [Argiope bruennichi]
MVTTTLKILFLITVTVIFCTIKCNADAVKIVNSSAKCTAGSSPKYLPHETDCSLFYVCLNGKTILKKCPSNLHFNRHSSVCDYPEKVDCDTESQEKLGRETTEECPSENRDQPVLLPHKKDCGKFYICDAGVPHLKSCQPGLHFNPALHTCDYPENAGCDSGFSKKGRDGFDILCPVNEDGNPILRPHETDCRKFYTCNNGITLVHVCQHGLHFNAELQACDYPENAGCEKGVTKLPKGKEGNEIPKNQCPLGQDGKPVLIPHETDCRKFYSCNQGYPHLLTCQSGLHFNPKLQACDYPENVGCETDVPNEEPKGKTVHDDISNVCSGVLKGKTVLMPNPNDCSKFFICDSGVAHPKSCPAGLHFSVARQACDYPNKAQCDKNSSSKYN